MKNRRMLFCLLLLFAVSLTLKILWVFQAEGPMIFGDENKYVRNAYTLLHPSENIHPHHPLLYSLSLIWTQLVDPFTGYRLILCANALFLSLLIFPLYHLGRRFLPPGRALILALLSQLQPYQAVYPRLAMSENLFIPLFITAVYYVFATPKNYRSDILLGFLLALLMLTRYLGLFACPFLTLAWISKPWWSEESSAKSISGAITSALLVFFAFFIIIWCWLFLLYVSDRKILSGLGLAATRVFSVDVQHPDYRSALSAARCTGLHLAYLILSLTPLLPALLLLAIACIRRSRTILLPYDRMLILLVLSLTAIYLAMSIEHTWSSPHHVPQIQYINGRYLLQLAPLYLLTGLLAFHRLSGQKLSRGAWILSGAAALALVYLAGTALFNSDCSAKLFNISTYCTDLEFQVPETYFYNSPRGLPTGLVLSGLLFLLLYLSPRLPAALTGGLLTVLVCIWLIPSLLAAGNRLALRQDNFTPPVQLTRHLAAIPKPSPMTVLIDAPELLPPSYFSFYLHTFRVSPDIAIVTNRTMATHRFTPQGGPEDVPVCRYDTKEYFLIRQDEARR